MAYSPADSAPLVPGALAKGRGLPDNLVRNGRALSAETVRRVADQLNFLLGCGQVIGWRVFDGDGYPAVLYGSGSDPAVVFYGDLSPNGNGAVVDEATVTLVVLSYPENDGGDHCEVYIEAVSGWTGAGSSTVSSSIKMTGGPVSATVPNDLGISLLSLPGLSAGGRYRFRVFATQKRAFLGLVLFEGRAKAAMPNNALGQVVVDTGAISAKSPVTAEALFQSLAYEAAQALWQYPKVLVHQSFWYGNASPSQSTNSASYLNIIDKTSTTVTSTTPGWSVDVSYSDRLSSSAVSATFCVRAYVTAGTGTVILLDQAGTTLGTISVTATSATDHTTTVTLTGGTGTTTSKVDVHFKCSGGTIHVTDFALLMTN